MGTSLKWMEKAIIWMFMFMCASVTCDTPSSCHLNSKLVQYSDVICQIDYQSCSNTTTLTISDCVGYSCSLSVGERCYYYTYESLTDSECMSSCCGYNLTSPGQDYSDPLGQCITVNQYQTQSRASSTQPPSNKIAIILGAVMGAGFVIVVISCVCCREKLKALILPDQENNNPQNPQLQQQNRRQLPQVETIANINFNLQSTSTQMHYEKQEQCTICLEQTNNCRTHCLHWYHLQCLMQWVKKGFRCPNCTNQEINPITVFCMECKRPYAEIKISKYTEPRQLQLSLNSYKCNQCKNQH